MKEIKFSENEIEKWVDGKKIETFFSLNPARLREQVDSWYTHQIEGRLVHQSIIFDVVDVYSELPSGKAVGRTIVINPSVICVVPVDDKGNILFVRQIRPISPYPLLELPAGHINKEESAENAAIREMGEETGFEPANLTKLGSFFSSPGWSNEFVHSFLVTGLTESALEPDEDEEIELVKVPIDRIMNMIERGEINCAKTIASLLLALPKLKEQG